jgi:NAD-dependent SIR2 family protein deacetylase
MSTKEQKYKCPSCTWIGTLDQVFEDGTNCEVKRCPECADPVNLKNAIKIKESMVKKNSDGETREVVTVEFTVLHTADTKRDLDWLVKMALNNVNIAASSRGSLKVLSVRPQPRNPKYLLR